MALRHQVGWDPCFARRSAWFWPLAAAAEAFAHCRDWPTRTALDAMYRELTAVVPGVEPLCFADNVRKQDKREGGRIRLDRLYDGRIAMHGEVPTREGDWHDFFNALCFATFPRAKRALHLRQYSVLQGRVPATATRLPPARTREQDALTLFDEGGALIAAERPAYVQLCAAAGAEREQLLRELCEREHARVVPFGHALFEHLVEGLRCPGGFTQFVAVEHLAVSDGALLLQVDAALHGLLADPNCFRSPRAGSHLRLDALGLWPDRPDVAS
jgi:hypothetical protein